MIWFRVTVVHSGGIVYVTRNLNSSPGKAVYAVIDELQRRNPGMTIQSTNVIPDPVTAPTVPA